MSFDAIKYINSFSHSGKKVTDLSRMLKLAGNLGNPQKNQKFVHIAGTNGKGSVLEYMSRVFIDAGYKTGQFTSPFVEVFNDRIRINGECIPDTRLADICLRVSKTAVDEEYSQFEITLAAALIYFMQENCDIIFLETGIGGLLDATNIVEHPLLSVITSVSLDHTQILGGTLSEIAAQKAGIIKRNCPVVLSADNSSEITDIVRRRSETSGSELTIPDMSLCRVVQSDISGNDFIYKNNNYRINMCGSHQIFNAATAIEAIEILRKTGFSITQENIFSGLAASKVRLRIETVQNDPMVIVDGGHNISGIDSLISVLKGSEQKIIGVFGMVDGKPAEYAAEKLSGLLTYAFCADGYIENSINAGKLEKLMSCPAESADYRTSLKKALDMAKRQNAAVLICGSLYLASAAIAELSA